MASKFRFRSKITRSHGKNHNRSILLTNPMWVVFVFAVQGWWVRGACNPNIGDDLSGVLSPAPTIDALCTHGLVLEAADENRIAEGISPSNDPENTACLTYRGKRAPPARCCAQIERFPTPASLVCAVK